MSYPDNDYRGYLKHSNKGQKWSKHKYLYIDGNGNYVYPDDVKKKVVSKVRSGYKKSGNHSESETRTVNGKIGLLSYKGEANTRKMTDQSVKDKKDKTVYYFRDDGSIKTFKKRSDIKKNPPKKSKVKTALNNVGNKTVDLADFVTGNSKYRKTANLISDAVNAYTEHRQAKSKKKLQKALGNKFGNGGGTTTVTSGRNKRAKTSSVMSVKKPLKKTNKNTHGGSGRKF